MNAPTLVDRISYVDRNRCGYWWYARWAIGNSSYRRTGYSRSNLHTYTRAKAHAHLYIHTHAITNTYTNSNTAPDNTGISHAESGGIRIRTTPIVTLSPDTIVAIGSLIGGLIGALGWLFRMLVISKNEQIRELESDRDIWREMAIRHVRED